MWILNYIFQIRNHGSVILKYGSGSRRPSNYESGRIRIPPGHFCGHCTNMLSYRGSKSLKTVKYWTFLKTVLFLHFSESESVINSKDPDPYFKIYGSGSGSRRQRNYRTDHPGSTTLLTICSTRIEFIRFFRVSLRRRSRRSSRMRRRSPGVSWRPGMNPSGWSRRGESSDLSVSKALISINLFSKSPLIVMSHLWLNLSKSSLG